MLLAPNGDIFVTEIRAGRGSLMHPATDGSRAAHIDVFALELRQPFGLAFYPNAQNPQWMYVAETNRVVRYPYRVGDARARGDAQVNCSPLQA